MSVEVDRFWASFKTGPLVAVVEGEIQIVGETRIRGIDYKWIGNVLRIQRILLRAYWEPEEDRQTNEKNLHKPKLAICFAF
jgi:hypothetical protein